MTIAAAVLLAAVIPASAKSGVTKNYNFKNFTGLSVSGAIDVELTQSDTFEVSMTMPSDYVPYFKISVNRGVLKAGFEDLPRKLRNYMSDETFQLSVKMPEVTEIDMSGATRLSAEGGFVMPSGKLEIDASGAASIRNFAITAEELEVELSGASNLDMDLRCRKVEIDASGASKADLKGEADDFRLELSGASNTDSRDLSAKDVDVELSGACRARVTVLRSLKVDMSGASRMDYYTEGPIELDIEDISGACSFRKGNK